MNLKQIFGTHNFEHEILPVLETLPPPTIEGRVPVPHGHIPVGDLDRPVEDLNLQPCKLDYRVLPSGVAVARMAMSDEAELPRSIDGQNLSELHEIPFDGLVVAKWGLRRVGVGIRHADSQSWHERRVYRGNADFVFSVIKSKVIRKTANILVLETSKG